MRRYFKSISSAGTLLLLSACFSFARGETAILECAADGWSKSWRGFVMHSRELTFPGILILQFRRWTTAGLRPSVATLLLHLAEGKAPQSIAIAPLSAPWSEDEPPRFDSPPPFRTFATRRQAGGWMRVELPGELIRGASSGFALRLRSGNGSISARETGALGPYLILESSAAQ
jgi:hypothetical protein